MFDAKVRVGAAISPMTLQSSSGEQASSSLGSAAQGSLVSPTLISSVPPPPPPSPAFVDPMLAFVDEWCLEEDCSVLKPQLLRRCHNGSDTSSPLDHGEDVVVDAASTARLESNIAKKISIAILRRLRLAYPAEDDTSSLTLSTTHEPARSPQDGSAAIDNLTFSQAEPDDATQLKQFDSTSPPAPRRELTMERSQSFDATNATAIFQPSSRRQSVASPSARETKLRKDLLRCIAALATVTMDSTRKLHEARQTEYELRRELVIAQSALADMKVNSRRRSTTTTLSHLFTARRASAVSNDGSMPPARRRGTTVGIKDDDANGSQNIDSASVEEESLRPPPLMVEIDTPRGVNSVDLGTTKHAKSMKNMADVMIAMSRAMQHQHQQKDKEVPTPHSESETPRALNPLVAAMSMSVKSMMAGVPLTPQTMRAPKTIHNEHAAMSIDDIGMPMVNQYLFLSELGTGSQGSVSLALDTETQDLRAIKVIPRPPIKDGVSERKQQENAKKMSQLRKEIAIMKRCRHKNVVALYEVIDDEEAEAMYLVMQYVEKGPVATITGTGVTTPIAPHRLAAYSRQLCSGLLYLHSRGIIHRDIKPDNILLGSNDTVYLADFGISSIEGADLSSDYSVSPMARAAKTTHQVQRGTIAFLAPELLREDPASPTGASSTGSFGNVPPPAAAFARGEPVDVWALGLSIYTLLYGRLPWKLDSVIQYVNSVVNAPIEFPSVVQHGGGVELPLPLYTDWLVLLQGMLNRDENQRFTAEQAYRAAKTLHQQSEMGLSMAVGSQIDVVVGDADIGAAITAVRRGM